MKGHPGALIAGRDLQMQLYLFQHHRPEVGRGMPLPYQLPNEANGTSCRVCRAVDLLSCQQAAEIARWTVVMGGNALSQHETRLTCSQSERMHCCQNQYCPPAQGQLDVAVVVKEVPTVVSNLIQCDF